MLPSSQPAPVAVPAVVGPLPALEPIEITTFGCPVCGDFFDDEAVCRAGFTYVPPDPFPVGSWIRLKEPCRPESSGVGQVIESEVGGFYLAHRHYRKVTVQLGSGGRSYIRIDAGYDGSTSWELVAPPA